LQFSARLVFMRIPSIFSRIFKLRGIGPLSLSFRSFFVYKDWFSKYFLSFALDQCSDSPSSIPDNIYVRANRSERYLPVNAWNHGDRMTINEVFCWNCYNCSLEEGDVVCDLGGNIGVSACYFLSRKPGIRCYIVEPNIDLHSKLILNLGQFDSARYHLDNSAIGPTEGRGSLQVTSHSRYNSLTYSDSGYLDLKVVTLISVIENVIERFGSCNVLKIDIEGLGFHVLNSMPYDYPAYPRVILIEEDLDAYLSLAWLNKNYLRKQNRAGIFVYSRIQSNT